jgi:WD40-like Beta Propeller Repeat
MRYGILLPIVCCAIFCLAEQRQADGGDLVKAINLEKLNSAADEEDPCPTPDGLGLLYAKKVKASYDIFLSKRTTATTAFGAGKPFIADPAADERAPFMHQGKYYFVTNEVPDEKFAKLKNFDIMVQIGTQRPERIISQEINTKADEMYPWVTPGGKEFYFSRKTADGWKLFVANGPTPGPISKAKAVGFPADFHRATVAGKGLVMYLQGPLENGKIGIFRSKRDKVGETWSKPEPVSGLNHPDSKKGDMQPALTADGLRLYFVSDRPGGKGGLDIWTVTTALLK